MWVKTATHTHTHTLKSGTVVSEMLLGDTSDTWLLLKLADFAVFSGERLRKCMIKFDFYVDSVVYVSGLTDIFDISRLQSVVFGFHL
jgi:hypothetical protein